MTKQIELKIVTPDKVLYKDDVEGVSINHGR